MDHQQLLWVIVAACAAAAPVPFIKWHTQTNELSWLLLSFLAFSVWVFAYSIILVDKDMVALCLIVEVLSLLLIIVTGYSLFNHKLDYITMVGILLGIASLGILGTRLEF
jgi:multidrug transporter EmrE-like cation transporter